MKKLIIISCILLAFSLTAFAGEEEKVTITPYGYVKLDAIYETGNGSHGNWAIWAKNSGNNDGLFHMTANQTRLGFAIKGFSFANFKVTGKVEVDFYGGGAENKALNFMRHAYVSISNGSFTIIAGQYWDIISPLNASTLNYPVLWGAGNIGYRRPQIRIKKVFKTGKSLFTMEAGIFRTIAGDYDSDGVEDGTAAGVPTIQARIAGKFSLGKNAFLQLGVSGHTGKTKGMVEYDSNSLNADLLLVFSPKFKIIAEYFSGKNLGTFLGGIVQSVNLLSNQEVEAKGFYVCAVASLSKMLQMSAGYGMDDPEDSTLIVGARSKNTSLYGNLLLKLGKSLKVGLELSNWETEYLFIGTQKTLRLQNSWIFSF